MKKPIAAATAALMLAGLAAIPASAETATYSFPEYGFTCSVPSSMYVFTQDMDENDPALDMVGITYEEQMDYMTGDGSNIIFNANDVDVTCDLTISVYESDSVDDFDTDTEDQLNELLSTYVASFNSDSDTTVNQSGIEYWDNYPYVYISYTVSAGGYDYHFVDYETVRNGYDYVFTIYSFEESLSATQLSYLTDLLNTAEYTTPDAETPETTTPSDTGSLGAAVGSTTTEESDQPEAEESAPVEDTQEEAESAPAEELPAAEDASDTDSLTDALTAVTSSKWFLLFSILGGLAAGLLVGLIPLLVGRKKGQTVLAWVGFGVSALCGVLLGLLLALPVAIVFLIIILVKGKNRKPKGGPGGYYPNGSGSNGSSSGDYSQNGFGSYNDPFAGSGFGSTPSSGPSSFSDPWDQ